MWKWGIGSDLSICRADERRWCECECECEWLWCECGFCATGTGRWTWCAEWSRWTRTISGSGLAFVGMYVGSTSMPGVTGMGDMEEEDGLECMSSESSSEEELLQREGSEDEDAGEALR